MAFIRSKQIGKHPYYYLVKSERNGSTVRQKVLCYMGKHDSIKAAIAASQPHLRTLQRLIERENQLGRNGWSLKHYQRLHARYQKRITVLSEELARRQKQAG